MILISYFFPSIVEIYPREGTETNKLCLLPHVYALKFIPVRGRKLDVMVIHAKGVPVEIYPREGTETHSSPPMRHNARR